MFCYLQQLCAVHYRPSLIARLSRPEYDTRIRTKRRELDLPNGSSFPGIRDLLAQCGARPVRDPSL